MPCLGKWMIMLAKRKKSCKTMRIRYLKLRLDQGKGASLSPLHNLRWFLKVALEQMQLGLRQDSVSRLTASLEARLRQLNLRVC